MRAHLPAFTRTEVESHNCEKSCYVTIGDAVYDAAEFLQSHPGGADLVLKFAGHDVTNILSDPSSHPHSEVAYEILNEYLAGFVVAQNGLNRSAKKINHVATGAAEKKLDGVSCEEDLSEETDFNNDYTTPKFLDLNSPLFPQVWFGGFSKEFYLDQVHRPKHYKDGKSAPVFGNFLEPFSLTPWWIVPTFWMPPVSYGVYISRSGLSSAVEQAGYLIFGFFFWSLIEYTLHRFLFHLDKWLPDNRVAITLHFLLHGIHHYLPMDKYRLVMPPVVFIILASPFWKLAHVIFFYNWSAATSVFCGSMLGYISYDLTHYFLHHRNLPLWYKQLKKYHLQHHFLDYELGFGVTTRFWDEVFSTEFCVMQKVR